MAGRTSCRRSFLLNSMLPFRSASVTPSIAAGLPRQLNELHSNPEIAHKPLQEQRMSSRD